MNQKNLLNAHSVLSKTLISDSKYKGKIKSFTITNPDTLIPYLDVTDELKDSDLIKGNPKLGSIDNIAREHVKINFEKIWQAEGDNEND